MRRNVLRLIALPLAAIGTTAAVIATAGAASAASDTISGGSGTVTFVKAFTTQVRLAGIGIDFDGQTALVHNSWFKAVTYASNGGDAQVNALAGNVNYDGTIEFENWYNGKDVVFSGLTLDMFNAQIDGTSSTDGSQQQLFDTVGNVTTSTDATGAQTYSSDDLELDPAGAAYLNQALHTTVFTAGESIGSFTTTYTY